MTTKKILIFGFGYTASFLAKKLAGVNFDIIGATRDNEFVKFQQETIYKLVHFNSANIEKHLESTTHILVCTPPSEIFADPVLTTYSELLKKHTDHIKWFAYLSSTGVYGNHQGQWVDESSTPISPGKRGKMRLDAETAWTFFANRYGLPLHIFRLAAIYGPQKNVLTRFKQGKTQTIYKPNQFFSRIHVLDIIEIITASIQSPNPMSVYNVADDEPAPSHVVDEFAASLMNMLPLERVPQELATLSPMAREFYSHNRRVSNLKVKEELSIQLNYPTYREGLKKIYDDADY